MGNRTNNNKKYSGRILEVIALKEHYCFRGFSMAAQLSLRSTKQVHIQGKNTNNPTANSSFSGHNYLKSIIVSKKVRNFIIVGSLLQHNMYTKALKKVIKLY